MKKSLWLVLVLGLAFAAQGCGFDPTIDSSVMIVKVTPTPEVKSDTYYASSELNLRSDASADADLISSVAAGTQLNSTGVCENGWIRVDYNGQTCYASGDFVTTTAPAADAGETAADTSADTSYDESAE